MRWENSIGLVCRWNSCCSRHRFPLLLSWGLCHWGCIGESLAWCCQPAAPETPRWRCGSICRLRILCRLCPLVEWQSFWKWAGLWGNRRRLRFCRFGFSGGRSRRRTLCQGWWRRSRRCSLRGLFWFGKYIGRRLSSTLGVVDWQREDRLRMAVGSCLPGQ